MTDGIVSTSGSSMVHRKVNRIGKRTVNRIEKQAALRACLQATKIRLGCCLDWWKEREKVCVCVRVRERESLCVFEEERERLFD